MTKEVTVTLATQQDWSPWYEQLQRYATGLKIWEYIDPNGSKELVSPKRPTFDDALDDAYAVLLREYEAAVRVSSVVQSAEAQSPPTPPQEPTRPDVLTPNQQTALDQRRED